MIGFSGTTAIDSSGNIYFADTANNRVRRIAPNGVISTVVGNGAAASAGDGGPASAASIDEPFGINLDSFGNLYILEAGGHRIRRVNALAPAAPTFTSRGVTNGASFASGGISVGSIVTIFGVNLSSANGLATAPGAPLPTSLAGVSITVDSIPAGLFAVFRDGITEQINLQWPFIQPALGRQQGQGSADVVITNNGVANAPVAVPIAPAQPGIFIVGQGLAAITHADASLVTAQSPAQRGEVLIVFCTGLGAVDFPPATGAAASRSPLSRTAQIPIVTIGGAAAGLAFSGLAPDFVGLYQINLTVPQLAPIGVADIVITQGGIAGPPAPLPVN